MVTHTFGHVCMQQQRRTQGDLLLCAPEQTALH